MLVQRTSFYIILYLVIGLDVTSFGQSVDDETSFLHPLNHCPCDYYDPNKEYDDYREITISLYIGNDPNVKTKERKVHLSRGGYRWIKENVIQENQYIDLLEPYIWHPIKIDDIYEDIIVPKRLSKTPPEDIIKETFLIINPTKRERKGGCDTPFTFENQDKLVIAVKTALIERGYQIPPAEDGYLDDLTKAAIEHYQIQNNLPICGELETETLRYLGIKPPER